MNTQSFIDKLQWIHDLIFSRTQTKDEKD